MLRAIFPANKFLALTAGTKDNNNWFLTRIYAIRNTIYAIRTNLGDLKMNEDQGNPNNLLDTTDCLEAIGVFRGWKNFLFVIIICCLLLLQGAFWLVNIGWVKAGDAAESGPSAVAANETKQISMEPGQPAVAPNQIKAAAKQAAAEPNQPTEAAEQIVAEPNVPQQQQIGVGFLREFKHWSLLIRFVNFVLVLTAALYCLTMLFSLKVSMLGRLGGINHISRAFFLSLAFIVLLLPWQRFFAGVVVGAMFTPAELLNSSTAVDDNGMLGAILYYLRFTGYWLVVVLLFIFSQLRSARWSKAILRRLEVI
jgi:hypothetical protein